jgi:hypothetical protein
MSIPVEVVQDMKNLFDFNEGNLTIRHQTGTFKVISWVVLAKCPVLATQINKLVEEKKEFDLSSFSGDIVKFVFKYIYYRLDFDFDNTSAKDWFQLYDLAKMFDLKMKSFDGRVDVITKYADYVSKMIDIKSVSGNLCDVLIIAHEQKDDVRMKIVIEKIAVILRKKIGKTCFDSITPGTGVRPSNYINFVCCGHSHPAPATHSHLKVCTTPTLQHNGKEICYNFTSSNKALPSKVDVSLCCTHNPEYFREVVKFKALPAELQKEVLKQVFPKDLLEGLTGDPIQIIL